MRKLRGPNQSISPTAIDLFSGCGGLTTGLRLAGFSVRAAVEIDEKAVKTYRLNHPSVRVYRQDIRRLPADRLLREIGLRAGKLDLLAGCPPCQGFSRLRTRNKAKAVKDSRNDLIMEFLRFVRVIRPKMIMLENVPALANDWRFKQFCAVLTQFGYTFVFRTLNAEDYSVPQRRVRLIVIGSRVHTPNMAPSAKRRLTVRDALKNIEHPTKSRDALHSLPERRSEQVKALIRLVPRNGGSRSDLPRKYELECHRRNDGFHDVYGRMAWDAPAPTITTGCINPSKGRFLHPTQNRTITLREAAILQGFSRRYAFDVHDGKEAIASMIGNALPPPFVAAHAKALRRGLPTKDTRRPGRKGR